MDGVIFMSKIKLEYSETQKAFHFNTGDSKPNTNSYKTVCRDIERDAAKLFIEWYDKTNSKRFTFRYIINEFKRWQK